jgi:hypothetical protein
MSKFTLSEQDKANLRAMGEKCYDAVRHHDAGLARHCREYKSKFYLLAPMDLVDAEFNKGYLSAQPIRKPEYFN